jgi:hypothetical protein
MVEIEKVESEWDIWYLIDLNAQKILGRYDEEEGLAELKTEIEDLEKSGHYELEVVKALSWRNDK